VESELDLLLGTAINSLLKLELLLRLLAAPAEVRAARELAAQLRRPPEEVERALRELAEAGLVDWFALGSGRHVLYGPRDDDHVQELLRLLEARYRDPATRAHLVRQSMQGREPAPP